MSPHGFNLVKWAIKDRFSPAFASLLWPTELQNELIRAALDGLVKYPNCAGISGIRENLAFVLEDEASGFHFVTHGGRIDAV